MGFFAHPAKLYSMTLRYGHIPQADSELTQFFSVLKSNSMNAIAYGIETLLTPAFRDEILEQTKAKTLEEALTVAKVKFAGNSGFETE